jgi:quinol monooxygenase YgiN
MSEAIYFTIDLTVKDGQLDAFKAVANDLIDGASKEEGTLNYEWSIGDDQKTVRVYERYADSAAYMTHLAGFGKHAEAFMATVDITGLIICGKPNAEAKAALADFGPTYLSPMAGFAK